MSIVVFSGSLRSGSYNTALAAVAARELEALGVPVWLISLADYPLPLYHGDTERDGGVPEPARALRRLFAAADGFVIASPEYNGSISPVLKNTLDWVSRKDVQTPALQPFADRLGLLLSTANSSLGGQRGVRHLRDVLNSLGVFTLPKALAVASAGAAFDAAGELVDAKQRSALVEQLQVLASWRRRLTGARP